MSAYQETKIHGTPGFPYIVYPGILPEHISGIPHHWHEEMEIIYADRTFEVASMSRRSEVQKRLAAMGSSVQEPDAQAITIE